MPYVEGGHNDTIFPWKGLPENASKEKDNKDTKYPFGNLQCNYNNIIIILIYSCSCSR